MEKPPSSPGYGRLREEFLATGDAARLLAERTRLVDERVLGSYEEVLARAFPGGLAVLAVGGFGRRELFPHSDVDLLLLAKETPRLPVLKDALSEFLRRLWDQGLRLSHSVRTPAECCEVHDQNIELNISILDQRFLAGDRFLYEELTSRLPRFLFSQRRDLIRRLCRLARERHGKYNDTIQHLEPNIKEAPGGLRDLQCIHWLSLLQSSHPDRIPSAEVPADLAPARDFLHMVRCFLHFHTGRDQNVLTFEEQDEIAKSPPFGPQDPAGWMRDYFRHARDIRLFSIRSLDSAEAAGSTLLSQFRDWRSRLSNDDFTVSRERVFLRAPHRLEKDPLLVLRLFAFVARHGLRLSMDAENRVAARLPLLKEFFSVSAPLWPALEEILSLPHAALAVECMQETGVLYVVFPELAGVECLVVRDFYHRYTVDEHTLVSIQALTGLAKNEDPARLRFAELFEEIDKPGFLLFTLLFHDAGKATLSGAHVTDSLRLAETAMARIQMPEAYRATVKFLIERHLDLSKVMSSRDLEEPVTARFLAGVTGTLERLAYLALITYADISAVNPTAMSPWRLTQLWRAYIVTREELTRELDTSRIDAEAEGPPERTAFLKGFPTRYLLTHTPEEIDSHLRLRQAAGERGVGAGITKLEGVYALTLIARDRPFLLASAAGALAGFGMNILKAEAFSNRRGLVLDTFVFADPNRTLDLNPTEIDRLRLTVERAALGKIDVNSLLRNRPQVRLPIRGSHIPCKVSFDAEASPTATLIEIVAQDRPGLLHDLAEAISQAGCNIEVILIDTEAHRALDVFYVTYEGRKLPSDQQQALQQSLQKACSV